MLNIQYNEGMWKVNIKSQHSPHRQELRESKNEGTPGSSSKIYPLKKITKSNPFHTFKQSPHEVSSTFLLLNMQKEMCLNPAG